MKKLLISVCVLSISFCGFAQDNKTLARIAYEDAETALSDGNYSKAIEELNNVDRYLGKVTPKAQYLKVQAWNMAAAQNGSYVDRAVAICKDYLDLSTSFELPEEKVMEVTRLIKKLQNDKTAYIESLKELDRQKAASEQKKIRAAYLAKEAIRKFDLFVLQEAKLILNEHVDSFAMRRPEVAKLKRDNYSRGVYSDGIYGIYLVQGTNQVNYLADNLFVGNNRSKAMSIYAESINKVEPEFQFLSELGIPPQSFYSENHYQAYYKDENTTIKLAKSSSRYRITILANGQKRVLEYDYNEGWLHHTRATVTMKVAAYEYADNDKF